MNRVWLHPGMKMIFSEKAP